MPPTLSVLRTPTTAPSSQDRYQVRRGSGLTPQVITGAQRLADTGDMSAWADLLDEIRQGDLHLHGDLQKRELSVAGAPFEVRPTPGLASGNGRTQADRAVALCRAALDAIVIPPGTLGVSFRGALAHLQTGLWHGRAALEVVWAREGRYLLPREFYPVHARRLAWQASSWKLHIHDATTGGTRFATFPGVPCDDPEVFPPGKLLVHLPRVFGTYPTREGVGRGCVWFSAFKRWGVRDWLAFAEWAGRGLRVGKYASGRDPKSPARANDEDVDALQEAIEAMSSTVATVIPDVTDLEILAAQDNDVHENLVKLCNAEMSKAILGGTLTSDPGERGARSLGEVHLDAAQMLLASDAEAIAEVIRRDLFTPVVRMNLGPRAPVPTLALNVAPPKNLDGFAQRIDRLVRAGLRVPAGWVRDTLGAPDPVEGEEILGPAPTAPSPPEPAQETP